MTELDPRTIAADIMTAAARDVDRIDVWSHIGQAYDVLTIDENIDAKVLDLISKAGIDLIWPDGSKDTELDAARVEIERLRAELDEMRRRYEDAHADRLARSLERARTIDEREYLKAELATAALTEIRHLHRACGSDQVFREKTAEILDAVKQVDEEIDEAAEAVTR